MSAQEALFGTLIDGVDRAAGGMQQVQFLNINDMLSQSAQMKLGEFKNEVGDFFDAARDIVERELGPNAAREMEDVAEAFENLANGVTPEELAELGEQLQEISPYVESIQATLQEHWFELQNHFFELQHTLVEIQSLPEIRIMQQSLESPAAQYHIESIQRDVHFISEQAFQSLSPQAQQLIEEFRAAVEGVLDGQITNADVYELGRTLENAAENPEIPAAMQEYGMQLQALVEPHIEAIQEIVQGDMHTIMTTHPEMMEGADVVFGTDALPSAVTMSDIIGPNCCHCCCCLENGHMFNFESSSVLHNVSSSSVQFLDNGNLISMTAGTFEPSPSYDAADVSDAAMAA